MFTLSALKDSVSTIVHQRDANPIDLAPDGAIGESVFRDAVARDGEGTVFARSEDLERTELGQFTALHPPLSEAFPKISYLRGIVEFCDAHSIALTLVLPPAHEDELRLIDQAGLWNVYEHWLRSLAMIVSGHYGAPTPLWDFGGYSHYTTEPLPVQNGERTETVWFWDIFHFKRKLGDLIISRLLTGQPKDFGFLLTPESAEIELARERTAIDCSHSTSAPSTSEACLRFSSHL
jgi:hypothetical protein